MIKLSNSYVVANTSEELTALQNLLAPDYPEFIFEILDNTGSEKESFPFKLLVTLDASVPDTTPSMPLFFDFLLAKIDQLNNPA